MRATKVVLILALSMALGGGSAVAAVPSLASPPVAARVAADPTLVAVRAASHTGFDRVVWEFRGGLPARRSARYVGDLLSDGPGLPVRIAGNAIVEVTMFQANAHDLNTGRSTAPGRVVPGLPNVIEVVRSGDFEAVVTYGVGLAKRRPFTLYTLTNPSRVVLDVRKGYPQVTRRVTFLDQPRFAAGRTPFTRTVRRVVPAASPASALLHHLIAGPTVAERATGLRTVRSRATDFDRLAITGGVARVRLRGGCGSGGSTFTIANLIRPTLKQFPSVDFVKIYDPAGRTQRPTGRSDSIPTCLEP